MDVSNANVSVIYLMIGLEDRNADGTKLFIIDNEGEHVQTFDLSNMLMI